MLTTLEKEELLGLERVMHDGTKVRTQAGVDTFRFAVWRRLKRNRFTRGAAKWSLHVRGRA
ncbi:MAG: hypothetical protein M3Y07_17215 [Acidobacteriota bacterium]|nr:hypothetical protein [Acidobacteriota bacterium]